MTTTAADNGEQTPEWHSNGLFSKTYLGDLFNERGIDEATSQERIKWYLPGWRNRDD